MFVPNGESDLWVPRPNEMGSPPTLCLMLLEKVQLSTLCQAGAQTSSVGSECVGLAVLRDTVSPVRPASGRGDFSLGLSVVSQSIPPKLLQIRV